MCISPLQGMGQAAATQCVNAALAIALAESQLRVSGIDVRDPLATNAVDPCLFAEEALLKSKDDDDDDFVGVVTTAQLVYNANPCKLGMESIRSAAKKLARLECAPLMLEPCTLSHAYKEAHQHSATMPAPTAKLHSLH